MTYKELYFKYKELAKEKNKEETAIKLLIHEISNFSSSEFYLKHEEEVDENILDKIIKAMDLYLNKNIPVQYILGYAYFYKSKFKVNNNVLIPRRETEELVDLIVSKCFNKQVSILDIGTGSGAIAISLKKALDNSKVYACDISSKALEVAIENARINNVDVEFIESDVFSKINGKFDVIVSNPPYIEKRENVSDLVYNNEPHLALFASEEGLYFYRKILNESYKYLNNKSLIAFEIPEDKDEQLKKIVLEFYPNSKYEFLSDLQGKSRILIINNNWW